MKLRRCICDIEQYDIKEIRLLWNNEYDQEKGYSLISEFIIAPFRYFDEDYKNSNIYYKHIENNFENEHLYKHYNCDIGNCNFDLWKSTSEILVQFILLNFFFEAKFKNNNVREEALLECLKIKQMRDPLIAFFDLCNGCNLEK